MSTKPRVSIIIIFLNEEQFIQEAIDSVISQTLNSWELFLVDDGSTDGSSEIARKQAAIHPGKVYYLEHVDHENRGMSASRNLGITQAEGDYVAFLDADDIWLPNKLEEQVPFLDTHPTAAMLFGQTLYWYGWTGKPSDVDRDYIADWNITPNALYRPPELLAGVLNGENRYPSPSCILIRRKIIEEVGGFEEERYLCEDLLFYTKIFLNYPVYVSDCVWEHYRLHQDSACAIAKANGLVSVDWLAGLIWIEKYLSSQGVKDPVLLEPLHSQLRRYRHPSLYRSMDSILHYASQLKDFIK